MKIYYSRWLLASFSFVLLSYSADSVAGFFSSDPIVKVKKERRLRCNPDCVEVGAVPPAKPIPPKVKKTVEVIPQPTYSAPIDAGSTVLNSRYKADVYVAQSSDSPILDTHKDIYLWRAMQAAVSAYPSIRSAMATLSQQDTGLTVARAGYFPSVKAGINAGHQGSQGNGQVLSVNATQMLYDFGKVDSAVSYAQASAHRQYAQVLVTIDDVARQTAQAVVEVHRFQLQQIAAQKQIDALTDLLKVAKARVKAGASNQADPVQASSRVAAATSTLSSIRTQLRQWRSKLKTLVREPIPDVIGALPDAELDHVSNGIEPQIQEVPQVQVAELELVMAKSQLDKAKSDQLPTISLSAGIDRNMGGLRGTQDDQDYNMTLNVTNSLFEGGALRAQEKAAGYAISSAQENLATIRLEVSDQWESLLEQIGGLKFRLPELTARQKSIVETRRLYREQYLSLGTRSLLDLLNSEQEIFQADLEQQNAIHDLMQARLDYLQATGQMRDVFGLLSNLSLESR